MKVVLYGSFGDKAEKELFVLNATRREGHQVKLMPRERHGHRVLIWGAFSNAWHQDPENWISDTLRKAGNETMKLDKVEGEYLKKIKQYIQDFQPHMILFIKPAEIPLEEFKEISLICKMKNIKVVMWNFDWMMHEDVKKWFLPRAKLCDYVFGTDGYKEQWMYDQMEINRIELHQGCDPYGPYRVGKLSRDDENRYNCDVAFVGSIYSEERFKLNRFLKKGEWNYKLFGNREDNKVWYRKFSKLCECAKIIIGDNYVNHVDGYWSDRVYLTLGHNGFLITHYVPGLEKEFTNHEHLVWWNTYEELEELIKYYLPKHEERKKIANAGYKEVHEKHTYDLRIRKMMEVIFP